jgi:hypothetical protein
VSALRVVTSLRREKGRFEGGLLRLLNTRGALLLERKNKLLIHKKSRRKVNLEATQSEKMAINYFAPKREP